MSDWNCLRVEELGAVGLIRLHRPEALNALNAEIMEELVRALEQMDAELAAMLRPRVERLGYLGEFFRCTAHQPEALKHFLGLTEALKQGISLENRYFPNYTEAEI